MVTIEERVSNLETEFRTELRHLATKADIAELRTEMKSFENRLTLRLAGMIVAAVIAVATVMRLFT